MTEVFRHTKIIVMQGDFFFSAVKRLVRVQSAHAEETSTFVLGLQKDGLTDRATEDLLLGMAVELTEAGKQLIIVDPSFIVHRSRFDSESVSVTFAADLDSQKLPPF